MAIQNAVQNELFQRVNYVTFTSSGTYTPPDNLAYVMFEAVGAASGRGRWPSATASDIIRARSMAVAGQTGFALVTAASLPSTVTITVGAPGSGGSMSYPAGGNTIVGLTVPISVSGYPGDADLGSASSVGTGGPAVSIARASVSAIPVGWDFVVRGQSSTAVLLFNRWPNMGTNFRMMFCVPTATANRSANGNCFSVNVVSGDIGQRIDPPQGATRPPPAGAGTYSSVVSFGTTSVTVPTEIADPFGNGAVYITEFLKG